MAVILNALRALRGRDPTAPTIDPATTGLIRRFSAEHDDMRRQLSLLRDIGALLSSGQRAEASALLDRADDFVRETLIPHEHAEDRMLYPALAGPLGSPEATTTMSRMHTARSTSWRDGCMPIGKPPTQPAASATTRPTIALFRRGRELFRADTAC